ncbi:molybdopterin-guanine dinucleotide biosynthesis protein MobA [Actinomyces bowdenii]|uniref:Molybdopterin-guanine dinucleotide biosynthesis protein MobA n=2 Tax=Actinomyces bowdenii TaxID=131109 RepID=A0A3P1VCZ0_9ACTO|nr:molybdopterin-guanine dinucleotide biosynthesis protein MobA [Actinomyces bowdenii]
MTAMTSAPEAGGGAAAPRIDVIVLAGGTAARLGGASKAEVVARGARLLDHILAGLARLAGQGLPVGRVCVVAPARVALPDGVLRALEDPPLGGPVAGIAAGLARLARQGPAGLTAVLTCDAPESWRALPVLAGCLAPAGARAVGPAGAVVQDGGHRQYLLGLYRTRALGDAVAPGGVALRDVAVRRALGALDVVAIPLEGPAARDLDTWEEIRAWDTP